MDPTLTKEKGYAGWGGDQSQGEARLLGRQFALHADFPHES